MSVTIPPSAAGRIREAFASLRKSDYWTQIVEPREEVLARFGPMFHPSRIPRLTAEEFRPFLYFENNHHWTGLNRQVNRLIADMSQLRNVLAILVDETRAIEDRLDETAGSVTGLGKAITTAILTVAYPDRYGVWNSTSEAGLAELSLLPVFERGTSFGIKYRRINEVLTAARGVAETDFWTLDAIWWYVTQETPPVLVDRGTKLPLPPPAPEVSQFAQTFGLERHLHDFLFDNWDSTELGTTWALYSEPGEPDKGYEFVTPVGRIDLLARHRTALKWLVVELKRRDTTDAVVGQAARYMGWVREHLAGPGDEVHGLIIAQQVDEAMHYAVASVPNLDYQLYEVEFRLKVPTRQRKAEADIH